MSRFIKSSSEKALLKTVAKKADAAVLIGDGVGDELSVISGFTEAEQAAAKWARRLSEVQKNYERTTNSDLRHGRRSRTARHRAASKNNKDDDELRRDAPASTKKAADKKDKETRRRDKKLKKDEKTDRKREKKLQKDDKDKGKQESRKDNSEVLMERDAHKLKKQLKKEESRRLKKEKKDKKRNRNDQDDAIGVSRMDDDIDNLITAAQMDVSFVGSSLDQPQQTLHYDYSSGARTDALDAVDVSDGSAPPSPPVLPTPRDPVNPLEQAYDVQAYEAMNRERKFNRARKEEKKEDVRLERRWDHYPFLMRSPSPDRTRTAGPMFNTRKDAWKSRAGGVYLPPTDAQQQERGEHHRGRDSSDSPARYVNRDQFKERQERRRSPSYQPEPRSRSSSTSSSSSSNSSSHSHAKRKKPKAKGVYLPFEVDGIRVLQRAFGGYIVDNSQLQATTAALAYRYTKSIEDKDLRRGATWGDTVEGIVERSEPKVGDTVERLEKWLKVTAQASVDEVHGAAPSHSRRERSQSPVYRLDDESNGLQIGRAHV